MLNFGAVELRDRCVVNDLLRMSDFRGCEYTFGNMFLWSKYYNTEIGFSDGFFFEKLGIGEDTRFIFPFGKGSVETAVSLIREYAAREKLPCVIIANKQIAGELQNKFPNVNAELYRDFCDYVYLASDLENLSGKKYHAKRNHLNRFYENDWSYEPLTEQNAPECIELTDRWCAENELDVESKSAEAEVVKRGLELFYPLDFTGGVIRVEGEVQAFTFGECSAEDTFVVHAEKALRKYQGAYAAINREFVKSLGGRFKYINREDDAGAENLRKAKLSYYPAFLEEKYLIGFK